jgi:hypothetical protein
MREFSYESAGSSQTFHAEALAGQRSTGQLLLASVAGPSSSVKALSAILHTKCAVKMRCGHNVLTRYPGGYICHKARLGCDTWHLLAIADCPELLLDDSDETLWRLLHSERFTTPLLRAWLPYIRESLKNRELLTEPASFGCKVVLVQADSAALDDIVSWGLKGRQIAIA